MDFILDDRISDYDKKEIEKLIYANKKYIPTSNIPCYEQISGVENGYIYPVKDDEEFKTYCDDEILEFETEYRLKMLSLILTQEYRLVKKGYIIACKSGGDIDLAKYFEYSCFDNTKLIIWRNIKYIEDWCISLIDQYNKLEYLISIIGGHLTIFNKDIGLYSQSDGSNRTTFNCKLNNILDNDKINNNILKNAICNDSFLSKHKKIEVEHCDVCYENDELVKCSICDIYICFTHRCNVTNYDNKKEYRCETCHVEKCHNCNKDSNISCEKCNKILCVNCIAITGCQTDWGICRKCYNYKCCICGGKLFPEQGPFIVDTEEYEDKCIKCKVSVQ